MVTITGGVVLKQNGTSVTFKSKCEKCGNDDSVEITLTLMKGVSEITTRKCSKCGNNQIVKMKLSGD
ncbi:hypothetical protein CYCD_00780 [Tenuifilaceae bacterium CYCD]|nr:hypothetical protein CYCD_00780 [Tenuifilaceae bacterium CYCD]